MVRMSRVEVAKVSSLLGHRDCVYTLEKSGVENQFFSSGGDGMVVVWDLTNVETGIVVAKTNNSIYALHLLEENNQLLIGENFAGLHVLDISQKKEVFSTAISNSSIFDIKSTKKNILIGTGDGNLIVLEKEDFSTVARINLSDKSLRSIAVNGRTNHIATAFSDQTLKILDLENFKVINSLEAHGNSIFAAVYSPDGKYLLTGGRDAHLKIWDVENNYELKESIVAHMFTINHIAFSPDGNYFATCSMDKSIKLWDANEYRLLKVIDKARHAGHGTSVNKLYWSSYNDYLISASDDRTISVWKLGIDS